MMGWRYKAGLGLIGTAVLIWVASAEVTQKIFEEYKQPFAITYLMVSLMVVFFPIAFLNDRVWDLLRIDPFRRLYYKIKCKSSRSGELNIPLISSEMYDDAETASKNILIPDSDWDISEREEGQPLRSMNEECELPLLGESPGLGSLDIVKCSLYLTPIWFLTEDQKAHNNGGHFRPSVSSIIWIVYSAVLLKKSAGSEGEKVGVHKFFGYIGLFTLLGLWWLGWPLHALGVEPELGFPPSTSVGGALVLNGLVGSVLLDYFWALSIVWTTPLVATLGMSLTIPLAMVADMLVHGRRYSAIYIFGCVQVFAGFVVANLSDMFAKKPES
ncbi:uncharacterized protein LOC115755586 isoform X2 [Rhodamnia argentea]|uniref:Uncharacterized protein LOC115755586 isoform X2 n=1 Tax=Rhodamnia argentea TaxID=178133 RepID=A0A8B8QX57_9MYRT|nr:uncharacterized protein LOC115755586 isoform X2 [Rhodamnia argentea]